jgi:AAA family ATP:ADP antiporter
LSFATSQRPGEGRALALSFCYFALLLASYYMIRPLRDALGAGSGAATIKYLATAVFVAMLLIVPAFGWLVAHVRRTRLLPLTYGFFALNLVVFGVLFVLDAEDPWIARVFYVWTTVFNLFVVSVFWSFMAEVWREEQGRRLFGVIAAGGSLGGLAGPLLTKALVGSVGTAGVAFIAAGLLAGTVVTIVLLSRQLRDDAATGTPRLDQPVGGAILAGLSRFGRSPVLGGIALTCALGSLLGMIVYIEMARLAGAMYATVAERTAFYSQRDLWVNGGALLLQFIVVGRLSTRFGVRVTLTGAALLAAVVFVGLALAPVLGVLVAANVALRSTEFGVGKPNRDMLYTVVDPETKYKVKNVVDTVIYRGSDMASSWIHGALVAAGATLASLAWLAASIGLGLAAIAWGVGTGYRRRGGT